MSQIERPTLRYTRRRDRWLAVMWPPRRRRLLMMQRIAELPLSEIQAEINRVRTEMLVHGTSYTKVSPN